MNYVCSELQGALYQPKEFVEIDDCWVISACKDSPLLTVSDLKLIFVHRGELKNSKGPLVEYLFVYCYQFLFCLHSHMYKYYSLRLLNNNKPFILNGVDISDVEKQVKVQHTQKDTSLIKNFAELPGEYCTLLPSVVNFKEFYGKFKDLFTNDKQFKEIVTLYCETTNGLSPLYDNVLQKMAQLQTIFETLIGVPSSTKCGLCGTDHYNEDWETFLGRQLKEYGITNLDDIHLIVKIKTTLNKIARVKYVHYAKYFNPNELQNIAMEIRDGKYSDNNISVNQILETKPELWRIIDWNNVYMAYSVLVRNLMYLKNFSS